MELMLIEMAKAVSKLSPQQEEALDTAIEEAESTSEHEEEDDAKRPSR